jgi:predicted nucleotidyltransferase
LRAFHLRVEGRHLNIARRVTDNLLGERGDDLLASGVMGSVALGEAGSFSDVDMIVLLLGHVPRSGKNLFPEVRRMSSLGEELWKLRTETVDPASMERLARTTWSELLTVAQEEGVPVDDLR